MAELVYAAAGEGIKPYSGGFFACAAVDLLGPARGSLTTEVDPLSAAGTVVRESQQLNSILSGMPGLYASAADTLILDIPLKGSVEYGVWVTYRIEGTLDVTDGPLLRQCTNEDWGAVGVIGFHGISPFTTSSPNYSARFSAPVPHYRLLGIGSDLNSPTINPLHFRVFSEVGTDIEFLLDQVYFMPVPAGSFPNVLFSLDNGPAPIEADDPLVDGADGGDANGKFTLLWEPADTHSDPGDYQRKSDGDDAEYFIKRNITDADWSEFIYQKSGPTQIPGNLYSVHTVGNRGQKVYTHDTFDNRNTGGGTPPAQNLGLSPEGYGYSIGASVGGDGDEPQLYVDGTQMVMNINYVLQELSWNFGASSGVGAFFNQGAALRLYDQWEWSGKFGRVTGDMIGGAILFTIQNTGSEFGLTIGFNFRDEYWDVNTNTYASPHHPWDRDTFTGFRIEIKRYWFRMRIWDATGAEPSTWDEEFFLALDGVEDYPYGDDLVIAKDIDNPVLGLNVHLFASGGPFPEDLDAGRYPNNIVFQDMKVEHNPYGDPAPMNVRLESPTGTLIEDVEVPYGAPYFVKWGKQVWTDFDPDQGEYFGTYAMKLWNDPAAAEIQRAEAGPVFLWFSTGQPIIIRYK